MKEEGLEDILPFKVPTLTSLVKDLEICSEEKKEPTNQMRINLLYNTTEFNGMQLIIIR